MRINGNLFYQHGQNPIFIIEGVNVTSVMVNRPAKDENPIINMTITVEATVRLNKTQVTCDVVAQNLVQETAILIVQGRM